MLGVKRMNLIDAHKQDSEKVPLKIFILHPCHFEIGVPSMGTCSIKHYDTCNAPPLGRPK